jgi:hypothetical protein
LNWAAPQHAIAFACSSALIVRVPGDGERGQGNRWEIRGF